jgi:hypothetical protein
MSITAANCHQLRLDPDALVRDLFGIRLRLADERLQPRLQALR